MKNEICFVLISLISHLFLFYLMCYLNSNEYKKDRNAIFFKEIGI